MSLDDEIRRKQEILRRQIDEEERKRKLEEAWRVFTQNSPFGRSNPVVITPPYELKRILYEIKEFMKFKNPKVVKGAPDGTMRAAIPANNGSSNRRTFDIVLKSIGTGKDLKSLGIWVFGVDTIAFVRNNSTEVTWEQMKAEGITADIVRNKVIEAIALQNITKSTSTSSNSGCYIATAVYGSYDCPEVWVLRRYRDYKLMNSFGGRFFVKGYYAISPTLVRLFSDKTWFKNFWLSLLNKKVVNLKVKGFSDEQYNDR